MGLFEPGLREGLLPPVALQSRGPWQRVCVDQGELVDTTWYTAWMPLLVPQALTCCFYTEATSETSVTLRLNVRRWTVVPSYCVSVHENVEVYRPKDVQGELDLPTLAFCLPFCQELPWSITGEVPANLLTLCVPRFNPKIVHMLKALRDDAHSSAVKQRVGVDWRKVVWPYMNERYCLYASWFLQRSEMNHFSEVIRA